MTNTSHSAAHSAREAARQGDGKFGAQLLVGADDVDLAPLYGVTVQRCAKPGFACPSCKNAYGSVDALNNHLCKKGFGVMVGINTPCAECDQDSEYNWMCLECAKVGEPVHEECCNKETHAAESTIYSEDLRAEHDLPYEIRNMDTDTGQDRNVVVFLPTHQVIAELEPTTHADAGEWQRTRARGLEVAKAHAAANRAYVGALYQSTRHIEQS